MSIFRNLKPDHIPAFMSDRDDLQVQREIVLQNILNTILLFSLCAFIYYGFAEKWAFNRTVLISVIASWLVFAIVTVNRRLPYILRSVLMLATIASVATVDLLHNGLSGSGTLYLLTLSGLTAALFGIRIGLGSIVLVGAFEALIGWMMITNRVRFPTFSTMVTSGEPIAWGYSIFSMLLCGICLSTGIFQFATGFSQTLKELRTASQSLEKERSELEVRVSERTKEISHKAVQLEAARQVAARIAAQSDIAALMQNAVDVVKEQFGFYYTAIFLPDENSEFAVLQAGTGDAGQQMLARRHNLKIGETGIVGYVMSKGEPRISGNVEEDPAHYKNPYLPDTRSEMGVPMRIGEQVIGVLDAQSDRRNAFSPDYIDVLQTIADQLASALDRARLLDEYEKSIVTLQTQAQSMTLKDWRQHLRNASQQYAYRYNQGKIETISVSSENIASYFAQNMATSTVSNGEFTHVAIPIKLRNQPLGIVNLRLASSKVSDEMINLLQSAVERMTLSLDNVRLLEEIQYRADRERMVGEISSKVRAATDIESILQITANELGHSLGVSEVVIQLAPGG